MSTFFLYLDSHNREREVSVQFSRSVVSDSLQPHGLQHARSPCPSPTPGVYSNSCLLSQWWYPTISSSVIPFSSCPQSFPASGSFQMSQFFAPGSQSIGISVSSLKDTNLIKGVPPSWPYLNLLPLQGPASKYHQIRSWSGLVFFFFLTFYFVLECNWLIMLWQFQVDSKGTQPYIYMYPFSGSWDFNIWIWGEHVQSITSL